MMAPLFAAGIMEVEPGLAFWTLVTFVLLFLLLRWKAWGPILHAVEEREKRMREAIEGAKRDREEAQRLLEEHRKLMAEARKEGQETVRKELETVEAVRSHQPLK